MSGQRLDSNQNKLLQAALESHDRIITAKQCEAVISDPNARQVAQNFLLGVGLLKLLKDAKGSVSFRAVTSSELKTAKDLSSEDNMVLNHIQASHTEGIWVKHLKAKTNMHQVVLDKSLKVLIQRGLIKRVPSVQHKTRKIYMLANLEPSVEITGGPWYTDGELDTEFIKLLSSACLHFIKDRSYPKQKQSSSGQSFFAIGAASSYPSPREILAFLNKSKITGTNLAVEHIDMLLNVLVLDGEIEKIPAFGASTWQSYADEGLELHEDSKKHKKRKVNAEDHSSRGKKRRAEDDSEDEGRKKKKFKSEEAGSENGNDGEARHKLSRKHGKAKSRSRHKEDSSSSSDSDVDEKYEQRKSKGKGKAERKSKSKSRSKRESSSSSGSESSDDDSSNFFHDGPSLSYNDDLSEAYVFRAIRQERLVLGWSQVPCLCCPSFDICKDKGPVTPADCKYFDQW